MHTSPGLRLHLQGNPKNILTHNRYANDRFLFACSNAFKLSPLLTKVSAIFSFWPLRSSTEWLPIFCITYYDTWLLYRDITQLLTFNAFRFPQLCFSPWSLTSQNALNPIFAHHNFIESLRGSSNHLQKAFSKSFLPNVPFSCGVQLILKSTLSVALIYL